MSWVLRDPNLQTDLCVPGHFVIEFSFFFPPDFYRITNIKKKKEYLNSMKEGIRKL